MYLINKIDTPVDKSKDRSPVLLGLLVLACSVLLAPAVEAAAPKVVIAKVAAVNEGANVVLDGSASSDKDGDTLTYKWEQANVKPTTPVVAITNATSASASFKAPAIAKTNKPTLPRVLSFKLSVSDGSKTTKKTVAVTVKPINQNPVANAGANKTVTWTAANAGIALDGSKSSDDGQLIKYQWKLLTKLPAKTKFKLTNATKAGASFIVSAPEQTAPLTLNFELKVTDNDLKTSVSPVTVNVLQTLPVPLPVANAGNDQTAISEATVNLSGSQSTGTISSYAWAQTAGTPVTLSSTNAATTSFVAPTVAAATPLTFELTVTNATGSSKDTVVVTVNPKPVPLPVANAGLDQTVAVGAVVNLSGSLSTGTIASYGWAQTAGPAVVLSSATTVATSFTAPSVTQDTPFTFELTTTNATGSAKDTVVVTVTAPVALLTAELSLPIGIIDINDPTVAVISKISGGKEPYSVTYTWGDGQATSPKLLNAGIVTDSSEEHFYAKNGTYTVNVKVTDANNASREFSGTVSVSDVEECK